MTLTAALASSHVDTDDGVVIADSLLDCLDVLQHEWLGPHNVPD